MKYGFTISLLAALAVAAPARAAQPSGQSALRAGILRCAAIADALNRLECYDRLARQVAATPAASATTAEGAPVPPAVASAQALAPPPGKWQRKVQRDHKGEITAVTLQLPAAAVHGSIGGDPPILVLRCRDTETSVAIEWQNYIGSNSVPVTLRLDRHGGAQQLWQASPNGSGTGYPGNAIGLIRRLSAGGTLDARVSPYGGYAIDATFDLTGITDALVPLRKACHW